MFQLDILIFIIIILFASILQTATGFGFSIIATPFLLLLFEPSDAIQLNIIVSLFISVALINKIKKDIDFVILKRFIIGSLVGLPIGLIVLAIIEINMLKLGVSLLILLLTVLLLFKLRINQTKGRDIVVGGLSGVLTSSIGMGGPPILLYFSGTDTNKEKIRATSVAFYIIAYLISLIGQIVMIGTNKAIWISSGFAVPLVIIGIFVGQFLFKRFNQRVFRIVTYFILLFSGVYLFIESIV